MRDIFTDNSGMPHASHFGMYVESYRKVRKVETNSDLNDLIRCYCFREEIEGVMAPSRSPPEFKKQVKLVY